MSDSPSRIWCLEGWDTFAREPYPLPGRFPSREAALLAAQDCVYLIGPSGERERIWPENTGSTGAG